MHNWINKFSDHQIILSGTHERWDKAHLQERISTISQALLARKNPKAPVGILADNGPEWIAIDLATQSLGVTLVPLPSFFTPSQWVHTIRTSGIEALFCPNKEHARNLGFVFKNEYVGPFGLFESAISITGIAAEVNLNNVQKITFTSGTTSEPKGVCLSTDQQWSVAEALESKLRSLSICKHLNLLPLSVLLENIAGVYTALLCGAENICLPVAEVGLSGASQFNPETCLNAIALHQAESVIILPQMLQAITYHCTFHDPRLKSLKFVAVGGAKTPDGLILKARAKGIPAYEGYGLSECSSVVALNTPQADKLGSVGQPLAHRKIRIAEDGEIVVAGQGATQYLGEAVTPDEWLATGDLGHLDSDGYLFIDGRKKNVLITSYGRNVSPEWPESLLLGSSAIAQAVVVGDGQPSLSALIVPTNEAITPSDVQKAIDLVNLELPDYARIGPWLLVEPMTPANGLATPNGRPKRQFIATQYKQALDDLYTQQLVK
jgi:long-chain acyl-CoA synthetase